MAKANIFDKDGSSAGTVDLPKSLFEAEINEFAVHEAVVAYLANQRQGTVNTKERSDVAGGGKKPWKQKGTGRARAGTIRSPLWRGGGTVFGPHPREHRVKVNKKVKRVALKSSLTSRAQSGDVLVIKSLAFEAPKTKTFASVLRNMDAYPRKKTLVVLDKATEATVKSARNVAGVRLTAADKVNTYDVVWADKIVVTSDALRRMEEVYAS
ncbi:MAG TPA: 50S ribosomal protein L4 [Candidatus Krumholzibacteria bacterium]|nr:50S ribosomal protein L4 [Candidatus Krumholzibacteria bacterium]